MNRLAFVLLLSILATACASTEAPVASKQWWMDRDKRMASW